MKALYFSIFVTAIVFLSACSTPQKTHETTVSSAIEEQPSSPENYISKALVNHNEGQRSTLFFKAAQLYWQNNLLAQADAALLEVSPLLLADSELSMYLEMSLRLACESENKERIEALLPLIPAEGLHKTSIPDQTHFASLLARAFTIINQPINAAITLIEHRGLYDPLQQTSIDEQIWTLLRSSETTMLSQYEYLGNDINAIAWLDLARSIQLNQISLDDQYRALQMWQQAWPEHPASTTPPHELKVLQKLPSTRPDRITLALPLSGPIGTAGKAIRDGFMAQHYAKQTLESDSHTLEINFFDTAKQDILTLYNSLTPEDNNLIIGPLDKKSLQSLSTLDEISTPTLALNYLNDESPKPSNLYQLGLAPEAEARQIAQRLAEKQLTRVGIILPENNLGFRIYDAFVEEFSQLDGIIIESTYYKDQASLASSVARLLGTAQSQKRKQLIQRISQTKLEFLPRRRQDIDALIMIAKPEIARQIKPLFAYHYASKLPVFASSHIHSQDQKSNNKDLDNIEFIDMPWMLNNTIDIKRQLNKILPESRSQYNRFYALGADSYNIAPRLQLLQEVHGSQMQGNTGLLSMDLEGKIHRKMEWARFKRGKATIIKE